jgi:carboxymethylenebutenolidase
MEIKSEFVTTKVSDGTSMRLFVARPAGAAPGRGLLVMQEAFGVNAHIRDVTERFAREGFVAVAPELYHRTGAGFEGRYDDFPSAMTHLKELRDPNLEADFRAAYDWLRANGVAAGSPIAAVGFCMGGRAAVLAGITLPLECAVSFYGGGIAPSPMNPGFLGRVKDLKAPVLLFWGGRDQHITPEQRSFPKATTAFSAMRAPATIRWRPRRLGHSRWHSLIRTRKHGSNAPQLARKLFARLLRRERGEVFQDKG